MSVFTFLLAVNIAREKTTFQSCDGTIRGLLADIDAVSGKAVDNNIDEFPANGFCSQTCASNAWWAVDLNKVEKDIEVVIFSADLCCCKYTMPKQTRYLRSPRHVNTKLLLTSHHNMLIAIILCQLPIFQSALKSLYIPRRQKRQATATNRKSIVFVASLKNLTIYLTNTRPDTSSASAKHPAAPPVVESLCEQLVDVVALRTSVGCPVSGRYVVISLPGNSSSLLTLCEVQVFRGNDLICM